MALQRNSVVANISESFSYAELPAIISSLYGYVLWTPEIEVLVSTVFLAFQVKSQGEHTLKFDSHSFRITAPE